METTHCGCFLCFTVLSILAAGGPAPAQERIIGVASVIDGDTIEIHGQRAREQSALCEAIGRGLALRPKGKLCLG
jgi:endonuclease YncB( thermonuclease family)